MGFDNTARIPIIPLPHDAVLFPGTSLRIPVANRADVPSLLSTAFSRATRSRADRYALSVGCIPLRSSHLSPDGQRLIKDAAEAPGKSLDTAEVDPSRAKRNEIFKYGTYAKIIGVQGRPTSEPHLVVEGVRRFRVDHVTQDRPFMEAEVTMHVDDEPDPNNKELRDLFSEMKQLSRELLTLLRLASLLRSSNALNPVTARRFEMFIARKEFAMAGSLADFMTEIVEHDFAEKLRVLAALDNRKRLEIVVDLLAKRINSIKGNMKITTITSTTLPNNMGLDISQLDEKQREALVRRSATGLNGMPPPGFSGLPGGEGDEGEANELDELNQRLDQAKLPPEAKKVADRELKRLKKMNPANAEHNVIRTYLETLADIPWSKGTDDQLGVETLNRARKQLDDDHYGLEKIKKRLLEYLAVLKLKQTVNADLDAEISKLEAENTSENDANGNESYPASQTDRDAVATKLAALQSKRRVDKSPILLLVGPPGTGKTSLAKSVALSLGRKFHRISLGGVRDEAEIRGHRRTYVAAMPGLIVSGLRKAGVNNPVFLLDEIDKVGGSNFHGDPSAAMLEVLDPEQNHSFSDHYVNIPLDLSKVLFIATANTLDTIPPPLLDRMETIQLAGYTTVEKRHIARQHLIPKQIRTNGLEGSQVQLSDEVVDTVISSYTRESGVRNLEREIGSVCRYKAVQFADAQDASKPDSYNPSVSVEELEEILGIAKFDDEIAEKRSRPGIVTGLVAYAAGNQGSILFIEVADMPGNGRVQLTGKLGDVLKESVEVALTWVKAHSYDLGLTHNPDEDIMKNRSIHVHCPSGAIPKDGPSAGLAHTIALVSLFSGKAVPPTLAMTGEVSLRGKVHPVGGIVQKLIGASRAGVKTVLLPAGNRKDVKEVPQEVKDVMEIIYVK
ncbi:MAG: hypothetical protein Q9227_006796 [Pyrenula ochraceoflavens]